MTMHTILHTRLHRPAEVEDYVSRPRLLERLARNPNRALTLIVAPAGYGKTTLVASWLGNSEQPVAWISLDESIHTLRHFLSYVVAAVESLFPESCSEVRGLLGAPQAPADHVLTNACINALTGLPGPFILALDDVHLIHDGAIHAFLNTLINQRPQTLHLVLLSRMTPPISLAKLRVTPGQLLEMRGHDLRFDADETGSFIRAALSASMMVVPDAATLTERTEGWAAGLRMFALAAGQGQADKRTALEEFSGTSAQVMDYFMDQIMASQPPSVVDMLMRTSVLNRFCASLCDAVCEGVVMEPMPMLAEPSAVRSRETGVRFVQHVERLGLFITPLDARREWYRYHHLFQQALRALAHSKLGQAEVNRVHACASAWFVSNGYVEEAVQHALAAGDVEEAARIVEHHVDDCLNREDVLSLRHFLNLLPESVTQTRPELMVAHAWLLDPHYQVDALRESLDRIDARLSQTPHGLDAGAEKVVRAKIDILRSAYFKEVGQHDLCMAHGRRALHVLPPTSLSWRRRAIFAFNVTLPATGRFREAERLLFEELEKNEGANTYTAALWGSLCQIYRYAGAHKQLKRAAEHLLKLADSANLAVSTVHAYYNLGFLNYEVDDLDAAERHFAEVLARRPQGRRRVTLRATRYCFFGQVLTLEGLGRHDEAREVCERMAEFDIETYGHIGDVTRLAQARLALQQGDLETAAEWAAAHPALFLSDTYDCPDTPGALQASILIAQKSDERLHRAVQLLDAIRRPLEATFNTRQLIRALALQAVALDAQGRSSQALDVLCQALAQSQPGGSVRRFVDLGAPMHDLLVRLGRSDSALPNTNYYRRLLAAFTRRGLEGKMALGIPAPPRPEPTPTSSPAPNPNQLTAMLTYREQEVLGLLAESLSDDEIARRLFIAAKTVKRHTGSIYRKLGARNRRQAVGMAREMHILK